MVKKRKRFTFFVCVFRNTYISRAPKGPDVANVFADVYCAKIIVIKCVVFVMIYLILVLYICWIWMILHRYTLYFSLHLYQTWLESFINLQSKLIEIFERANKNLYVLCWSNSSHLSNFLPSKIHQQSKTPCMYVDTKYFSHKNANNKKSLVQ